MIDKITPKFLDKSSDFKLVRKTSLIDALNIYIDTETGDDNSSGVIKPIKGTQAIAFGSYEGSLADEDYKAIGSVTDENTGIVYFFVFSSKLSEHSIWAYDSRGILPAYDSESGVYVPGEPGSIRLILKASEFNFPQNGFVKGDIVYTNTREFANFPDELPGTVDSYPQKDALLYFTDNRNEPKKINVYRALMRGFDYHSGPATTQANRQIRRDFMSACPRVPMDPISFIFEADTDRDVNNFVNVPGFQFAYQNIYKDGLESAISPYSSIAFPPSVVDRGAAKTDNILAHNKCVITIPAQGKEVEKVRLLARYGNGANFIEIDEIDNSNPYFNIIFNFYNDRVAGGVSPQTVDKTFDNVPQRAQSQTVASNRLVYGNYVEGYENVDCTGVNLAPKYLERPTEVLDFNLEIKPSIELDSQSRTARQNKTIGFTYDTKNFPDEMDAGTQVNISFSMSPDKNFHIYQMKKRPTQEDGRLSYQQCRQVGNLSLNLPGYTQDGTVGDSAAFVQSDKDENRYGEPYYQPEMEAGGTFLHVNKENYFGWTGGCGGIDVNTNDPSGDSYYWTQYVSTPAASGGGRVTQMAYGTSAGNPLILKGGRLDFSVSFLLKSAITGGKSFFKNAIRIALSGGGQAGLDSEFGSDSVELLDVKRTHDHEIDLGLQDYDPIIVGTDLSYLICGVACSSDVTSSDQLENKPPSAAFIVNKANVEFYLEESTRTSATPAFRVCIASVSIENNDDVMTCVRDLDPRSPWWAIRGSTIAQDTFETNFLEIWNSNLRVPNRVYKEMSTSEQAAQEFNASTTRMFSMEFPSKPNGDYISGEFLGKPIMEACFGAINVGVDNLGNKNLLERGIDTSDPDADEFNYSLMDGEGGPGGSGAGEGTAYDSLGCDKYGSIAGQVFIGVDDSHVAKAKERGYVRYMASPETEPSQTGALPLGNADALVYLADTDIWNAVGDGDFFLGSTQFKKHQSVFMGPFYTGRIVMNNISVDDNVGNVNPGPLPVNKDGIFTTTLPLVYFSSWTNHPVSEGSDNTPPLILSGGSPSGSGLGSEYGTNQFQVSFPHPITDEESTDTGFVNGELVSGVLLEDPFGNGFRSVDFERLHSHMELNSSTTSISSPTFGGGLSFKSNATHEIGMVYYDERGRHGSVNPVGSVYVEGLGERNEGAKGRAFIEASNIEHTPPPWAKHYKFVYSKNTSIDKFIQYSAGGAFVANSDYQGSDPSTIYVSLNYLQGHPISYSDSFGARGRDNTPVMYSFTPGDRLRVLSYMLSADGSDITRVYPVGAEFEVTGLVSFNFNDTPFSKDQDGTEVVTEAMTGLFVALKNNDDATGFRYQSVRQGTDNWGNNCIFEIFSSKKELDADDRLYYEIGDTYDVQIVGVGAEVNSPATIEYRHQNTTVILKDGDVFFRKHAVNLRDFDSTLGFVDMLDLPLSDNGIIEDSLSPESNFKSYFLESEAATDLFPSRAIGIGRPNTVNLSAKTSYNESGIIHSDKDIIRADKVGYSSFNRTIPSTMDMDVKAGPLNYMTNHQDSIFFIQKNKCGHIPVDRNLISDTSGTASLIASSKFLGTPRYYAGQAGCDGNPESVVDVDNTSYFANKSIGKVFKVNGANGVNVISDKNVSTFIRNAFRQAVLTAAGGVRVIGGYDPLKKEYLLTIADNGVLSSETLVPVPTVTSYNPTIETISSEGQVLQYEDDEDLAVVGVDDQDFSEGGDSGSAGPSLQTQVPTMRIDWNYGSELGTADWYLFYRNNNEGAPLLLDASNHDAGGGVIGLSNDLALVIDIQNIGAYPIEESTISLDIQIKSPAGSFGQMNGSYAAQNQDLADGQISSDIIDSTGPSGFNIIGMGVPSAFHLKPNLNIEGVNITGSNADPIYNVTLLNADPIFNAHHGFRLDVPLTDDDGNAIYGPSEDLEIRIPIRFACIPEENGGDGIFQVQQNLPINNLSFGTGYFFARLLIVNEGQNTPFIIGNASEPVQIFDQKEISIGGQIDFQKAPSGGLETGPGDATLGGDPVGSDNDTSTGTGTDTGPGSVDTVGVGDDSTAIDEGGGGGISPGDPDDTSTGAGVSEGQGTSASVGGGGTTVGVDEGTEGDPIDPAPGSGPGIGLDDSTSNGTGGFTGGGTSTPI